MQKEMLFFLNTKTYKTKLTKGIKKLRIFLYRFLKNLHTVLLD